MTSTLTIHTDGGSRGNPGPAAAGIVICQGETVLHQFSQFLGHATNNHAEYQAVILALEYLTDHPEIFAGKTQISFILDSELVVRQLTGIYRVKHPDIIPLHSQVKQLISLFTLPISFTHVRRHLNHHADSLLNAELDHHSTSK